MTRNKIYIMLVAVGGAVAILGIVMRFSGKPDLYSPGTALGWAGIAIVVIGRIVFGRRRSTPSARNRP